MSCLFILSRKILFHFSRSAISIFHLILVFVCICQMSQVTVVSFDSFCHLIEQKCLFYMT